MRLEERLELSRLCAPLHAGDGALVLDEDECRDLADAKAPSSRGLLLDVHGHDAKSVALLSRQMVEQAVHAPGGPAPFRGEKDE